MRSNPCASNFSLISNNSANNSNQLVTDALFLGIGSQATRLESLSAMTAASFAFSAGRLTGLGLFAQITPLRAVAQTASAALGLFSEVFVYRQTQQYFEEAALEGSSFTQMMTDFGTMKTVGHLFKGHSYLSRHFFSAISMMAGQSTCEALNLSPHNTQDFSQRFAHAFGSSVALEAGTLGLNGFLGGRLQSLQRSLSRKIQNHAFAFTKPANLATGSRCLNFNSNDSLNLPPAPSEIRRVRWNFLRGITPDSSREFMQCFRHERLREEDRSQMIDDFIGSLGDHTESQVFHENWERFGLEMLGSGWLREAAYRRVWNALLQNPHMHDLGDTIDHPYLHSSDRQALVRALRGSFAAELEKPAPWRNLHFYKSGSSHDFEGGRSPIDRLFAVAACVFTSATLSGEASAALKPLFLKHLPRSTEAVHAARRILQHSQSSPEFLEEIHAALETEAEFKNLHYGDHVLYVESVYDALAQAYKRGIGGPDAHQQRYRETKDFIWKGWNKAKPDANSMRRLEDLGILLCSSHIAASEKNTLWQSFQQALHCKNSQIRTRAEGILQRHIQEDALDRNFQLQTIQRVIQDNPAATRFCAMASEDFAVIVAFLRANRMEAATLEEAARCIMDRNGIRSIMGEEERGHHFYQLKNLPWELMPRGVRSTLMSGVMDSMADNRETLAAALSFKRVNAFELAGEILEQKFLNSSERLAFIEAVLDALESNRIGFHSRTSFHISNIATRNELTERQCERFMEVIWRVVANPQLHFHQRDIVFPVYTELCCHGVYPERLRERARRNALDYTLFRLDGASGWDTFSVNPIWKAILNLHKSPLIPDAMKSEIRGAVRNAFGNNQMGSTHRNLLQDLYAYPLQDPQVSMELCAHAFEHGRTDSKWNEDVKALNERLAQEPAEIFEAWLFNLIAAHARALHDVVPNEPIPPNPRPLLEGYKYFWRYAYHSAPFHHVLIRSLPRVLARLSAEGKGQIRTQSITASCTIMKALPFESIEEAHDFWEALHPSILDPQFRRAYGEALQDNLRMNRADLIFAEDVPTFRRTRAQRRAALDAQYAYRELMTEIEANIPPTEIPSPQQDALSEA